MNQLVLKNQIKQKELFDVLEEIDKNILDEEEDIIFELEKCLKDLDDEEKSKVIQFISTKYSNSPFVTKLSTSTEESEIQDMDYQQHYFNLRTQNQYEQIILMMRNPKFCRSNNIPIIMEQNIMIIQKLGCSRQKEILQIWENQNRINNLTILQLLKFLVSIIFCNSLTKDEQKKIQIMLGSLLTKQVYQFQLYLEQLEQNNQKKFKQLTNAIRSKQMNLQIDSQIKEEITLHQEFNFLFELLTQDIKQSKQYLNKYLTELLNTNITDLNEVELIEKLEASFSSITEVFQCYFCILIYLWTQHILSVSFTEQLDQHEAKRDQTNEERRQNLYERFILKIMKNSNNKIFQFYVNRLILFKDDLKEIFSESIYEETKIQYQNYTQQLLKFQMDLQKLVLLPPKEYQIYLNVLKNSLSFGCCFYTANRLQLFQFVLLLTEFDQLDQGYFHYIFHETSVNIIQNANSIHSHFFHKSKHAVLKMLQLTSQIHNFDLVNQKILEKLYLKYKSFKDGQLLIEFSNILNEPDISFKNIVIISSLSIIQLAKIKYIFNQTQLQQITQQVLNCYLSNLPLERSVFQMALSKLFLTLAKQSEEKLECFRILLTNLNQKILHSILFLNNLGISSYQIFSFTLFAFYALYEKLSQNDQQLLSQHLYVYIKPQAYSFSFYHTQKVNNIEICIIHKMLQAYYYQDFGDYRSLELTCQEIYNWNREYYQTWLDPQHYFYIFSLSAQSLRRRELQSQYPNQLNIELESFNISLAELTEIEQETLVADWINDMSGSLKFQKLIPLFFNIIKRGESPKKLLSLIHKNKKKDIIGNFNMKALFQIFFNNANAEMKTMLLKFWSKNHPIPFIYQNFNCQRITEEQHLILFNQYLFYIWQDSFPIINLTFSRKRSQIGKTYLINEIFFQMEKFETCDSCEINQDTADISFDYGFNGSRHLSIVDIHGKLPISVLKVILPLFRFWIVQLNTEQELEENFNYLQNFNQIRSVSHPKICFLIRNSTQDLQEQFKNEISRIKSENIAIHFVKDMTSKDFDKQTLQNEMEVTSKFLFNEIKQIYFQKDFIRQDFIISILKQFNNIEYESFIEITKQHCQLISNIQNELNHLIDKPEGFFSQEAFPIRSIEQQIKIIKEDEIQLRLKREQNQNQLEGFKRQIEELQKQMDQSNQTKLMSYFCNIFNNENYYILYIWVTDKIRKFNEEKMYQFQNETQDLNEQIIKAKKERDEIKQKSQLQPFDSMYQAMKEKINLLKKLLKESMEKISLRNIGIEIFWRELIQSKQLYPESQVQINPIDKVFEMIKKGEPFEFLDGDQLQINSQFLKQLVRKFDQKGEERILVLSILGPQSSGKSTILNKIFGCHFWTSVGRCTKGIYLQLLKLHNKEFFSDLFDYILLLDTEGLQNPNQQDQEFDKKIALFILAVSDIILINVKGDINQQFKNLVEMCIYTLGQLKSNFQSIKQLCWCFNQNNDVNNIGPFFDQIQEIATKLNTEYNKQDQEESKIDYNEILDIKKQNIKILGFSSYEKNWKNQQFYQNETQQIEWRQLIQNETFSEEAYHYGIQIMKGFVNKFICQRDQRALTSLNYFITNIDENWNSIQMLPDLLEFSELIQHQQNQFMRTKFEEVYGKLNFSFIQKIPNNIFHELQQTQIQSLELFNQIQARIEAETIQKIEISKSYAIENLQQIRVQNKISKKITAKFIKQLEQLINNQQSECKLILYEEIKNYERQYQEKQGFAQIDSFVADLLLNSPELVKYQEQPNLINYKFDDLWQNIISKLDAQQISLFDEFQFNQFQSIEQTFNNYSMKSQNHNQYLIFFKDNINKTNYSDSTREKQKIFTMFKNELKQSHFIPLNKNLIQHQRYLDIFHQQIEKKIKNSSAHDLVQIGSFYSYSVTWRAIDKNEVENYFQNLFYIDLQDFWRSKKTFTCQSYFSILNHFKAQFDVQQYQTVVEKIKLYLPEKQKQQEDELRKEFFKFSSKIKFNLQESIFIEDDEFSSNFLWYYFKLKPKYLDQRHFSSLEMLLQERQNVLKQFIIIQENKNIRSKEDNMQSLFNYIQQPTKIRIQPSEFSNNFPTIFNDMMLSSNGWEKLFYNVYDIIKNEMFDSKNNQQSEIFLEEKQKESFDINNLFDENMNFSSSLIKIVMTKIEQQIEVFNKQFSVFGVILRNLGERIIYYYSIFIIWRFICSKKWGILEKNKKMLQNNYTKQLEKFQAKINQDKQQQTKIRAESLVNEIYKRYIDRFYLENRETASNIIQKKQMTSQKLINVLDDQLLKNFKLKQENQTGDEIQKDIVNYITDQVSFVNQYTDKYILTVQEEIKNTFEQELRQQMINFFQIMRENAYILKHQVKDLYKTKQELFIEDECSKDEEYYEQKLFSILVGCIQGEIIPESAQLKDEYRLLFISTNYKKVQQPIHLKFFNPAEQQVLLLRYFIEQVLDHLDVKINSSQQLQCNICQLQIQSQLDTIRLQMRGCQHSCPMCKRKCDLDSEKHDKHICQNGHQLRGMNGVLIDQTPSLFTCEEIEDDIMIATIETGAKRQWKEVKKIYPEWMFRSLSVSDVKRNKSNMMNVWNNGIGILICDYLEKQLNRTVLFQKKNEESVYFTSQTMHYILMLDDSGSMQGKRWANVKRAAELCIKEIQKNLNAKFSVIIFNSSSRLVIDCQASLLNDQQINFKGGGTNFNGAFELAFQQIICQPFDKFIILFYTDGSAAYPESAIKKFQSLKPDILARIQFSACTEEKDAPILNQIVETLKKSFPQCELKNSLQTQELNHVWCELVSQNFHKLRC